MWTDSGLGEQSLAPFSDSSDSASQSSEVLPYCDESPLRGPRPLCESASDVLSGLDLALTERVHGSMAALSLLSDESNERESESRLAARTAAIGPPLVSRLAAPSTPPLRTKPQQTRSAMAIPEDGARGG